MKAAVIGLGVEGKKALNSLLKYGCQRLECQYQY